MTTTPRQQQLRQVQLTMKTVNDRLLEWVHGVLKDARIQGLQVGTEFPPSGSTQPHLTLLPFRMGPTDGRSSNASEASLLTIPGGRPPPSTGRPEPWGMFGALVGESIQILWKKHPNRPRGGPPSPGMQVHELPAPLREWYEAREDWCMPFEDGRTFAALPSLVWIPGIDLAVHFLVSGSGPAAGAMGPGSNPTSTLMGGLGAIAMASHQEAGFDMDIPVPGAGPDLIEFCDAIRMSLSMLDPGHHAALRARELAAMFEEAKSAIFPRGRAVHTVRIGLDLLDIPNNELFSLMQAANRPIRAASGLRLYVRLGDDLRFAPAAAVVLRFPRMHFRELNETPPSWIATRGDP